MEINSGNATWKSHLGIERAKSFDRARASDLRATNLARGLDRLDNRDKRSDTDRNAKFLHGSRIVNLAED